MMRKSLRKNRLPIALFVVGVLVVSAVLFFFGSPGQIDATFNVRNMEKQGNSFLMSIGEETLLEWETTPDIDGTKIVMPDGLEKLGEIEEGIRVRAVKVGKWQLKVEHEKSEYSPSKEYFVCIGVTKEDARKNCD